MARMTVISGAERRRRWSDEDRSRILAAISEPGAVVAEVARRGDVCTSLVFKRRREMREAVEAEAAASGFAPVVIQPAAAPSLPTASNSGSAVIEVELKPTSDIPHIVFGARRSRIGGIRCSAERCKFRTTGAARIWSASTRTSGRTSRASCRTGCSTKIIAQA